MIQACAHNVTVFSPYAPRGMKMWWNFSFDGIRNLVPAQREVKQDDSSNLQADAKMAPPPHVTKKCIYHGIHQFFAIHIQSQSAKRVIVMDDTARKHQMIMQEMNSEQAIEGLSFTSKVLLRARCEWRNSRAKLGIWIHAVTFQTSVQLCRYRTRQTWRRIGASLFYQQCSRAPKGTHIRQQRAPVPSCNAGNLWHCEQWCALHSSSGWRNTTHKDNKRYWKWQDKNLGHHVFDGKHG